MDKVPEHGADKTPWLSRVLKKRREAADGTHLCHEYSKTSHGSEQFFVGCSELQRLADKDVGHFVFQVLEAFFSGHVFYAPPLKHFIQYAAYHSINQ